MKVVSNFKNILFGLIILFIFGSVAYSVEYRGVNTTHYEGIYTKKKVREAFSSFLPNPKYDKGFRTSLHFFSKKGKGKTCISKRTALNNFVHVEVRGGPGGSLNVLIIAIHGSDKDASTHGCIPQTRGDVYYAYMWTYFLFDHVRLCWLLSGRRRERGRIRCT